jgi:hypothetical protein
MLAPTRLISALLRFHPDDEALQAVELISQLAALAETIATWRRHHGRSHQAVPARRAAAGLRDAVASFKARRGVQGVAAAKWKPRPEPTVGISRAR